MHLEPSKIKLFHFCKKGKTFVIYYGWICKAGSVYLGIISRPQRITIAFQKAKLPPKKWSKNWHKWVQFPLLFSSSFLDKDPKENFRYIFQTIVTFHLSETPFLTCSSRTKRYLIVAEPDLEWGEGGGGVVLHALPDFLPSMISSFFTQKRGGGGRGTRASPLDPPTPLLKSFVYFVYWYKSRILRNNLQHFVQC